MEIRIKTPRGVQVSSLNIGDVVEYFDEFYMMTDNKDYSRGVWNCVNLRTGCMEVLKFDTIVFKLDTILTLHRIGEET